MARLKKYREQVLESEKNALGVLRAELAALNAALSDIKAAINRGNDELSALYQAGTTPQDIAMRKRFISSKHTECEQQQVKILRQEAAVERQLQVVITATQDLSTLEKLEEHQLEDYRAAELKETELFIEEFTQNKDFRTKNIDKNGEM